MGMFDYLRCKYPLPLPEFQENEFQTKDTPAQYLDTYEIREDGTLWGQQYDVEDRSELGLWLRANPDKEVPDELKGLKAIAGLMTRVNIRPAQLSLFTGEISFYKCLGKHNTGWIEFSSYFINGKLQSLTLIEHRPIDPKKEEENAASLKVLLAR